VWLPSNLDKDHRNSAQWLPYNLDKGSSELSSNLTNRSN
jgi:hypothetical protein